MYRRQARVLLSITLAFAFAVVLTASASSSVLPGRGAVPAEFALISSLDAQEELLEVASTGETSSDTGGEHDPPKMLLLSMAVPGAGQLVQGENRGYLYLLLEAAMWGGFYYLDQMGLDEREEYEEFVMENWNLAAYQDFFEENCLDDPHDYANGCRPLAPVGSQEFYEDVGKYDVYWPWWDNGGSPNDVTPEDLELRDEYWGMRKDSNAHLRQARYFMMAALLNHVVSAVDSFFLARSDDETLAAGRGGVPSHLGLEFSVPDGALGLSCAVVATY